MWLRQCPNSDGHNVFGTPYSFGGRLFVCPDCGMEWHIINEIQKVKYYQIDARGGTQLKLTKPFSDYPELKRIIRKPLH